MKTLTIVAALAASVLAIVGCASPGGPIPTDPPPKAETWQLKAAARYGLTTMEQNGIDLHGTGVLHGGDWQHYVDACHTARGLLQSTSAGALDEIDIAKAIAIAKAAVKAGQAAWVLANAAAIGEEAAAEYEAAGLKADSDFDAYAALHPD